MYELMEEQVYCPYCGEPLVVLIDPSQGDHQYVEDCQVCCRPIEFLVKEDPFSETGYQLITQHEDDVY